MNATIQMSDHPDDLQSHVQARLSTGQLIHLNALWFGLAYLWNGLHAILLPLLLVGLVPAVWKNTALGVLTFVGLALAMVVQPIAGAVSDRGRWLGHYGKRRPWIALGTALDAAFLLLLVVGADFWTIALGYAGLQIASSLAEAALQSLLPDLVPSAQRGRGAGFKNAAQILGFVAGVGVGGVLASQGRVDLALLITGATLVGTSVWTIWGAHERPTTLAERAKSRGIHRRRTGAGIGDPLRSLFVHTFRLDHERAPGYGRLLAGRAFLMAGYFALQSFAQYFVADGLGVANPAGVTGLLMAIMGAAIFLLAVPTGVLTDKIGRRPLNLIAGMVGAVATLSLILVTNIPQLVIAGGVIGASIGVFLSVNWAWATDLVPASEAGRYLGLSNLATAGASAFSRLVAGPIIDTGNSLQVGFGYNILFLILAAGMVLGTYLLAGVPETRGSETAAAATEAVRQTERIRQKSQE